MCKERRPDVPLDGNVHILSMDPIYDTPVILGKSRTPSPTIIENDSS